MSGSVTLTEAATAAVREKLAKRGTPDAHLRIGVKGGGCSGFSYVLEFADGPPHDRDLVFSFEDVKVLVDPKSILYLDGLVLDWEKSLMWTGFRFRNPNEKSTCGCGSSFTV